jgi:hypothetical protein
MSKIPQPVVISARTDPNTTEAIEFFRRLGMCVAAWAYVDRRLYQIFHHATGFEQKQSALLFYASRAFNNRLRQVDNAVKAALAKEQYNNEWKPLHDQANDLSHTRNIFAHHPTLRTGTARDGKPFDIYSIHIEPYERVLNNDYPGLRGKDQLSVEDLIQHEGDVEQIESALHNFAWQMGNWRASQKSRT